MIFFFSFVFRQGRKKTKNLLFFYSISLARSLSFFSSTFSPTSLSLSLAQRTEQKKSKKEKLTEHDDGGRPLPPGRPHARRRRDDREQRAAGKAEEHRDGPVGELHRQRRGGGGAIIRSGGFPCDDRGRPLHGKVDEERVEEDRDQVVERRGGDDERRDALGDAEPSLLQVKHQLDHDGGAHGLEDEPQRVRQQPGHAEDRVRDGARDQGLDDPGDEQQAESGGPGAAEDCPVELEPRPEENDG